MYKVIIDGKKDGIYKCDFFLINTCINKAIMEMEPEQWCSHAALFEHCSPDRVLDGV